MEHIASDSHNEREHAPNSIEGTRRLARYVRTCVVFSRCIRTYCFKNTALSFSHYCLLCLWTSKEGDSRIYTIRMLVLIRPPVKISHYTYRVTIYQVFRHTENLKGGYRIASRCVVKKNIDFVERCVAEGTASDRSEICVISQTLTSRLPRQILANVRKH